VENFDLIVIGAGTGLDVANAMVQKNWKVAIVEKDKMGGTCLNKGCIPSKLLIKSADIAEIIKNTAKFGITVSDYSIDFSNIVKNVNDHVDSDSEKILDSFKDSKNPKLYHNQCRFIGQNQLQVGSEIIAGKKFLIACGTRSFIPKLHGIENLDYLTSEEALRLETQPKILTIIGGGYIACELAHFFGSLGTKINIIQRSGFLLTKEDADISKKFTEIFSKKYNIILDGYVKSISKTNGEYVVIVSNKENKETTLTSDALLIATGRIPNSDTLDLDKTGINLTEKGYVKVNDYLETNVSGIFALGDVVGRFPFKHSANHEAKFVVKNLKDHNEKIKVNYHAIPHAIFTSPQIASVGYTENELKNQKIEYKKSIYPYIDTAMGQALNDKEGFVKLLIDKENRKILGCHIMGSHASILIHEVVLAMTANEPVDIISDTVHIHPALSEVISRASYGF